MMRAEMGIPVRVGIAGLGRSGWGIHARAVGELSELFTLVAVCDPDVRRQEEAGKRLDRLLTEYEVGSRSYIQKLIREGHVVVNGHPVKPSYPVRAGDRVYVIVPSPEEWSIDPEDIPLDVLFEDEYILVLNKPPGMVVHPGPGHHSGTLVNALLHHCDHLSGINGVLRPGIVHRLDRYTSGLLIVAKNDAAHRHLARQLHLRTITRQYLSFVWGQISLSEGRIEAPIGRHPIDRKRMAVIEVGGRAAATSYRVIESFDFLSFLALSLHTGRTHQIRVHLSHMGHPVFGDPEYGGRERRLKGISPTFRNIARSYLADMPRQALHAQTLRFVHPATHEPLEFAVDMPEDMKRLHDHLLCEDGC